MSKWIAARVRKRGSLAAASAVLAAVIAVSVVGPAHAQPASSKPLNLIVPYAAGGSTDVLARIVGRKYSSFIGQPVIVVNREGGGGAVGATVLKNAAPDGHTLLIANPAIVVVNPLMTPNLPYDPEKDFVPVQLLYNAVHFLYVPAGSPANSMADLITLARQRPGGLSYASQGVGSTGHFGGAMLQALSGAKFVHVPYKGAAPGMLDVAAGRADLFFSIHATGGSFVKAGTVKILAAATTSRVKAFPDVPTTGEAGFPSVILDFWFGLFAPAGTPQAVVRKLNEDFRNVVMSTEVSARMNGEILVPMSVTPAEMAGMMAADKVRYGKVLRETGARAE